MNHHQVTESANSSYKEAGHVAEGCCVQNVVIQQTWVKTVFQMFQGNAAEWEMNM